MTKLQANHFYVGMYEIHKFFIEHEHNEDTMYRVGTMLNALFGKFEQWDMCRLMISELMRQIDKEYTEEVKKRGTDN